MQKLTEMLERYVQWVAVAIGALFLAIMVGMYVIDTPVTGKIGGKAVTLNSVENEINSSVATRLEAAMANKQVPEAKLPVYIEGFRKHMALSEDVTAEKLAGGPWFGAGAPPHELKDLANKGPGVKVAGLPEVPAAVPYKASIGKSNVQTQGVSPGGAVVPSVMPSAQAAAAMPGAVGGTPGGMMSPGMYPGMMPPGMMSPGMMSTGTMSTGMMPPGMMTPGAMPPGLQAMMQGHMPSGMGAPGLATADKGPGGTDKLWVTYAFSIPKAELQAAFAAAKVPTGSLTGILRVELIRQEQLPDGSWGKDTVIEPLPFQNVPKAPSVADMANQDAYLAWAAQYPGVVMVPNFYPVLLGDRWYAPGQEDPNKPVEVKPAAATPGMLGMPGMSGMPGGKSSGMGRMPRNMRSGGSSGSGSGAGRMRQGGGGGSPYHAPEDAARPVAAIPGSPGSAAKSTSIVPEGDVVPPAAFPMEDLSGDIYVWAHDETVEPEKTYRYQVRYYLKNPLYRKTQLVGDPTMAKTLLIVSPPSKWSDPVSIPAVTEFFMASGTSASSSTAAFDVFHWQNGAWHLKPFTVAAGDMIGLLSGSVNYETGWTLVDLRMDAVRSEPRVILADPEGVLAPRAFRQDQSDEIAFKRLIDWQDPNAAPKVPGMPNGMPPGMMPPGGMPPGMMPPGMMPPGMMPPGGSRGNRPSR